MLIIPLQTLCTLFAVHAYSSVHVFSVIAELELVHLSSNRIYIEK